MKKKYIALSVMFLIVFAVVTLLFLSKFVSLVKGETETGIVKTVEDLPCFDKRIVGFPVKGNIHYLYHESLGRILVYFSGKADSNSVEEFCIENGWGPSAYNLGDGDIWEDFPKEYQPEAHFIFPDSTENIIYFAQNKTPMIISILFITSEDRFIVKMMNIKRK